MVFVFARTPAIGVQKVVMIALLSYLLYFAAVCPCLPLYACHRMNMYLALAACALFILVLNGFHFYNSTS